MSKSIPYTPSTTTPTPMPLVWHILMNCICMNWTSMWLTLEKERVSASGECHVAQARASACPSRLSFTIITMWLYKFVLSICILVLHSGHWPMGDRQKQKWKAIYLLKICLKYVLRWYFVFLTQSIYKNLQDKHTRKDKKADLWYQ